MWPAWPTRPDSLAGSHRELSLSAVCADQRLCPRGGHSRVAAASWAEPSLSLTVHSACCPSGAGRRWGDWVDILLMAGGWAEGPSSMRWAPLLFHCTDEETEAGVTQLEGVEPGFTSILISSRTTLRTRVWQCLPVPPPLGSAHLGWGRDKLCVLRKQRLTR